MSSQLFVHSVITSSHKMPTKSKCTMHSRILVKTSFLSEHGFVTVHNVNLCLHLSESYRMKTCIQELVLSIICVRLHLHFITTVHVHVQLFMMIDLYSTWEKVTKNNGYKYTYVHKCTCTRFVPPFALQLSPATFRSQLPLSYHIFLRNPKLPSSRSFRLFKRLVLSQGG